MHNTTHHKPLIGLAAVLLIAVCPASAALTIPGADGSDGAFAPTANVAIDLSLAATAA